MSKASTIRIGVVSQSRLIHDSLVSLFRKSHYEVINDQWDALSSHAPSLIVVQYGQSTLLIAKEIARTSPDVRFVLIDVDDQDVDIVGCIEFGVIGFVLMQAQPEDIVDAVDRVMAGEYIVPSPLTARLCWQLRARGGKNSKHLSMSLADLSIREKHVTELVVEGLSNKEIAAKLGISSCTVKSHVHNILEKLRIRSRLDLINFYWSGSATIHPQPARTHPHLTREGITLGSPDEYASARSPALLGPS